MSDDKRLEPVRTKIVVDLAFNRKGERVTTLDNCFFLPSDIKGYYNFYNQKGETLATGVSNNNEFPFLHDGHAWTIYELVIDDLRDYRFYAEDLVHPNYHATQYVWEKFTDACISENAKALMEEIHSINLAFQHKPFNPNSEQHKKFLHSFYERTKKLSDKNSYLDFEKELAYFRG